MADIILKPTLLRKAHEATSQVAAIRLHIEILMAQQGEDSELAIRLEQVVSLTESLQSTLIDINECVSSDS